MIFQFTAAPGFVQTLVDWGFLDAVLPFLLIFAIIFGVLQQVGLFRRGDKPNKQINGILAMVIAAMIVGPHVMGYYPPGQDPINMINQFLPQSAVLLVAILLTIMLLGLSGVSLPTPFLWVIALVALGFMIFTILMAVIPGFFPTFDFLRDPGVQAVLVIVLTIGLVGFFLFREPSEAGDRNFRQWLSDWLGSPPPPRRGQHP